MWHRRRTLLARREEFFRLQNLGALHVADFNGNVFDRRRDNAECCEEHRVAVARDHLGGDRFGNEADAFADIFLDVRVDIGKGADGARDRAGGDFRAGSNQTVAVARSFRHRSGQRSGPSWLARHGCRGCGQYEPCPCVRRRGSSARLRTRSSIGEQQVGGAHAAACSALVSRTSGRRHALVDEAAVGADELSQMREEGDDVMLGDGSISSIRATSKVAEPPFSQMVLAASLGMTPRSASASQA